ncbi:hypothetical protein [Thermoactinomyces mirandus]|uniref:Uncharacterized protein n=1 Tax=Thermoactinomyces mirandus TaxID=2756294 RepID=A0A7W1XSJ2_9BACL|nr:hypothetical protein [Thermoactinomyces mirandus]MBA4602508.1 hypothetical protein [Thermoactinomyces mirandus]
MGKRYARGQLKNGEEFQIVDLYPSDLDMILQLQKKAASQLPSPQLLQCLSAGEYAWILSGHGRMIGVFVRNRLVGCRAFLIPGQNEEYLGEDAGIGRGERSGIIYSEISIVDRPTVETDCKT